MDEMSKSEADLKSEQEMKSKNWTTGATAKAEFEENLKRNGEAGFGRIAKSADWGSISYQWIE